MLALQRSSRVFANGTVHKSAVRGRLEDVQHVRRVLPKIGGYARIHTPACMPRDIILLAGNLSPLNPKPKTQNPTQNPTLNPTPPPQKKAKNIESTPSSTPPPRFDGATESPQADSGLRGQLRRLCLGFSGFGFFGFWVWGVWGV